MMEEGSEGLKKEEISVLRNNNVESRGVQASWKNGDPEYSGSGVCFKDALLPAQRVIQPTPLYRGDLLTG